MSAKTKERRLSRSSRTSALDVESTLALLQPTANVGLLRPPIPSDEIVVPPTELPDDEIHRRFLGSVVKLTLVACFFSALAAWAQLTEHPRAMPLFLTAITADIVCGYLAVRRLRSLQQTL